MCGTDADTSLAVDISPAADILPSTDVDTSPVADTSVSAASGEDESKKINSESSYKLCSKVVFAVTGSNNSILLSLLIREQICAFV